MNPQKTFSRNVIVDARGVSLLLPSAPRRIVSLVPSITETLFDFGAGSSLVGRTRFCIRPPELVRPVLKIGGPKNPDISLIVAQRPDLVIANMEENEEHDIEALEREGILVFVTYPKTVDDGFQLLKTLSVMTGTAATAKSYIDQAAHVMKEVRSSIDVSAVRPRILYLIWRKPYMTVSKDTFIHDMIVYCGGSNVFADHAERYPAITVEDIQNAEPDIIILPSEPYRFRKIHREELMAFDTIPAVKRNKILFADGEMFSWYGTRMIRGLAYVRDLLSRNAAV